jgi:DNA-binding NtrC family response regulator
MIRIALADDHTVLRAGLKSLLERQRGFEVVGEACDGRELLRVVDETTPDVVITDIGIPSGAICPLQCLDFCGGKRAGCLYFTGFSALLAAFSPQRGEAFPLADELFDLAQAIAEDTIAHADYGQVWGFA